MVFLEFGFGQAGLANDGHQCSLTDEPVIRNDHRDGAFADCFLHHNVAPFPSDFLETMLV